MKTNKFNVSDKVEFEHYFTRKPTSEKVVNEITTYIKNHKFIFRTSSGMFSKERVDKGSELLIENAVIEDGWKVLDLGCGWGSIGIAIKKVFPSTEVTMIDINERAISLAKRNAKINNVKADIKQGNLYENITDKFDAIIVNPPMKAGRETCYAIIEKAKERLNENGLLQLVALHNKGGAMLEKKMKEVFGNVETVAKKSGFRVYISKL